LRNGGFEKLSFFELAIFNLFLLHPHENWSNILGYQGWVEILMITLISSQKSPNPNIFAASVQVGFCSCSTIRLLQYTRMQVLRACSRIGDMEVLGVSKHVSHSLNLEVAGHMFLTWFLSSNLIGAAKGFVRLLSNFIKNVFQ
jgi:hypothetical protein